MHNTLEYAMKTFHEYQMLGVWTSMPCKIVSDFVVEEMRVDVQPVLNLLYKDGTVEERPPILSVPVIMPATKSSLIYLPVQKGDIVLCLFSQRALDNFKAGEGDFQEPSDFRIFDKRDAIALPGLFPFSQAITAKRTIPDDPLSLSLSNNVGTDAEVTIQLKPSGDVVIKSPGKVGVECVDAEVTATNVIVDANSVGVTAETATLDSATVEVSGETITITASANLNLEGAIVNLTGVFNINGVSYLLHIHPAAPPTSPTDFSGPVVV